MSANGNGGSPPKNWSYGTFGNDKYFTKFNHEMYTAPAYHAMTAAQRLILRDMIGYFLEHSAYDQDYVSLKRSFKYSFADCRESVKRTAFYGAIKEIIKNGFFNLDPNHPATNGESQRFFASPLWRNYVPGQMELSALNEYADRRSANAPDPKHERSRVIRNIKAMNKAADQGELFDPHKEKIGRIVENFFEETNHDT